MDAKCGKTGCDHKPEWLMNDTWLLCPIHLPEAIAVVKEVADTTEHGMAVRLVRIDPRL